MKPAYLAVSIVLILVGGLFSLTAYEIWRLYHNGPETCSPPNSPPDNGPTCASIDAEIDETATVGIVVFLVAGIVLFQGRRKN